MSERLHGRIIAAYGRHYLAETPEGEVIECVPRGKKSEIACGDTIEFTRTGTDQGVVERIAPRSSLLYRSDAYKQKLIAANVTQLIIVVASEPSFNDELLARCLLAGHEQHLDMLIVLNKSDLPQVSAARERLAPYAKIGYRVLELSATQNVEPLRALLHGHTSVLVGQSGMGKSTLTNALIPEAQAATREISNALDSGKHTTTHATLYHLNADSHLIDCPGVQLFGLHHLDFATLERNFPEFLPYLGECRFANCSHSHEPDCAIRKATEEGMIDKRRLELFHAISSR
ncbi:MAG: ribosome small subunit-dependent GTPase A [Sideroxydans sp.]|nr:ribosome small subunit-dependent GTPase A [Sideroxydans sp.]